MDYIIYKITPEGKICYKHKIWHADSYLIMAFFDVYIYGGKSKTTSYLTEVNGTINI